MKSEESDNGKKPEAPEWLIDNIAEASKNTRKIYLMYLGFLAYCALTAISTTDRTLVLNEPAHLPIVNVGVPLEGFFIFAPILAIFTFVYLQLYLQNLDRLKTKLRDQYEDIDSSRLHPWIVNVIDDPEPGFIGFIQKLFVNFALGWTLPIVLSVFALVYIKKHDLFMSYYLVSLPFIAVILVVSFKRKAVSMKLPELIKKRKLAFVLVIIMIIGEIFFMACIIPWSMQGGKYDFLKPWICVDLSYQTLTTEPKTDYKGLFWGDFREMHLIGADLSVAGLKRANLRGAYLQNATLFKTIFQEASLLAANLQGASLIGANLQGTDLSYVNLQGAELFKADLQRAVLDGAYLQKAELMGADLQGADLRWANLQGVKYLEIEQLSEVKTLFGAQLDSALFEQVKDQYPHLLEPPEEE